MLQPCLVSKIRLGHTHERGQNSDTTGCSQNAATSKGETLLLLYKKRGEFQMLVTLISIGIHHMDKN